MDVILAGRVNDQLATELREAHTQLAKQEREIETLRAQLASLRSRHADTVSAFDACKDSLAQLQRDFMAAQRYVEARAYVNEIHDLALTEQAKSNEVRRPH